MDRWCQQLERYTRARIESGLCASEAPARSTGELELQARFYAGEFGLAWRGTAGEQVEAIHLGEWNREAGPDFVGAKLLIDGEESQGDIELDPEDVDWERHGHALNPAFENVVLHVFFRAGRKRFFTRTHRNTAIVQVALDARTEGRSTARSGANTPPVSQEAVTALVDSAARFRLGRKREVWLRAEVLHGRREALFQALAAGMGYKNNKVPFLLVAQRVRLAHAASAGGEALLFGIAGFLEAKRFDAGTDATRGYSRRLWDEWWAIRDREARLQLPADAWSMGAQRPQNHPHRRMGALAAMAMNFESLERAVAKADASAFAKALAGLNHLFWQSRCSLDGSPLNPPCALIGTQRAVDLAANILAPAAGIAAGEKILRGLRAGSPSGKVRRSMAWLGIEPRSAASSFAHQGLIQVYEDFHPADPGDLLDRIL